MAGVPTIGFGPAAEGDCRVVDERLKVDDLMAAAIGYGELWRLCWGKSSGNNELGKERK